MRAASSMPAATASAATMIPVAVNAAFHISLLRVAKAFVTASSPRCFIAWAIASAWARSSPARSISRAACKVSKAVVAMRGEYKAGREGLRMSRWPC